MGRRRSSHRSRPRVKGRCYFCGAWVDSPLGIKVTDAVRHHQRVICGTCVSKWFAPIEISIQEVSNDRDQEHS